MMFPIAPYSYILSIAAIVSSVLAINPLTPISDLSELHTGAPSRRQVLVNAAFDPQNEYSFLYAHQGISSSYVANFTLQTPGDEEAIIPIENFAEQLASIQCDNASNTITITFGSQSSYDYSSKIWDWVNKKKEHTFTLVTKSGQCDSDPVRDPFSVTDISFHPSDLSATLAATRQTWADAAHNFHLTTMHLNHGNNPNAHGNSAHRRSVSFTNNTSATNGSDEYVFFDDKINGLYSKAEDVANRLLSANSTNATSLPHLQDEFQTAVDNLAAAVEAKSMAVLKDIGDVYGGEVQKIVEDTQKAYKNLSEEADNKYKEADKISETDVDESWNVYNNAIELQEQASHKIEEAFTRIMNIVAPQQQPQNGTMGITAQRRANKRRLGKRFNPFDILGMSFKKVGEVAVNAVSDLLGANKPVSLNLATTFSVPLFEADKNEFGIGLKAGPELETGGNLVGEVDVKVEFDEPSTFRVKITPENIFARAEFKIEADGTLNKKLEKELAGKDIPVGGAGFEIPGLIKVGPAVHIGFSAGIERLEAKEANFHVGAKAIIPPDSIILLDAVNGNNNKVEGWIPQIEQIGPEFTGEVSGGVATWLTLGVNFGADILGGKFGAKAGIEAQAPKFRLDFNVKNDPNGVCDKSTNKTQAVEFGASVGIDIDVFAGLSSDPISLPIFQSPTLPLFPNQCFPFGSGGGSSVRSLPVTASSSHGSNSMRVLRRSQMG